jgi:hypothetical protein
MPSRGPQITFFSSFQTLPAIRPADSSEKFSAPVAVNRSAVLIARTLYLYVDSMMAQFLTFLTNRLLAALEAVEVVTMVEVAQGGEASPPIANGSGTCSANPTWTFFATIRERTKPRLRVSIDVLRKHIFFFW